MKKYIIIMLIQLQTANCMAQHTPNKWVLGSSFTNNLMDFSSGSLIVQSLTGVSIGFVITSAAIGDVDSNLLYYTNGYTIFDKQNNVIMNGDTLSPCAKTTTNYISGESLIQCSVFIPDPDDSNKIYVFHQPQDTIYSGCVSVTDGLSSKLYYSVIDKTANNGKGDVIIKNHLMLYTTLGVGMFVVKHGNGRDWWLIVRNSQSNTFFRYLISPSGISIPQFQTFGPTACFGYNNLRFSALTNKMMGMRVDWIFPITRFIDVYDFDRCTGLFTNYETLTINNYAYTPYAGDVAVSPNGRYLYGFVWDELWQYDLTAPNISASAILVDTVDSVNFVGPNYISWYLAQLAPDGKIYSMCWDNTSLSVINYPDSVGLACHPQHGSIILPNPHKYDLPNIPLYELGPLAGSACDTLTGVRNLGGVKNNLSVFPNPAKNQLTLSNGQLLNGKPVTITIYNVLGNEVLQQQSSSLDINIEALPSGLYLVHMRQTDKVFNCKFVKE